MLCVRWDTKGIREITWRLKVTDGQPAGRGQRFAIKTIPHGECACGHDTWQHTKRCRGSVNCKCKLSWQEVKRALPA